MTLFNGDCLEVMKNLENQSVDMVLADLPYGTTACKWDTVIPFEPLWKELHRVTKPNAAMCMFGSEPFSTALRSSNLKAFKYDWVWKKQKPTNFLQARKMPLKAHEIVSVFSIGKTPYKPQGLVAVEIKSGRKNKSARGVYLKCKGENYIQREGNFPRSIIEFKTDTTNPHSSAKPVALLEYLIRTYTNEGDTVLDPTMGSGSTGVACINTGRKFIGIEKDEDYFWIAERRLKHEAEVRQALQTEFTL